MDDPRATGGAERFVSDVRSSAPRRPEDRLGPEQPARPGEDIAVPSVMIEPPSIPDGTFVKVRPHEHPLPRACEVTVNFQDYHRSSSKLGRFGKIVGIDVEDGDYLLMLDNFECLAVPMRRVEWRKVAT